MDIKPLSEMEQTLLLTYRRKVVNGEEMPPHQRDAAQELFLKEYLLLTPEEREARRSKVRQGAQLVVLNANGNPIRLNDPVKVYSVPKFRHRSVFGRKIG